MTLDLYERLTAYGRTDMLPFHMPGHKRNSGSFGFEDPFSFDITEIDGFDNLHHAEGILRSAMEEAAQIYGSERSWFLVNGSSSGLLAAISACVRRGGTILTARNCHKSVYHGIFLRGLTPSYLCPAGIPGFGAAGAVTPEMVRQGLQDCPQAEAVLITSPTYEGVCSDIAGIAEAAHEYGIPLIVDSAHGAHFPFWSTEQNGKAEECADGGKAPEHDGAEEPVLWKKTLPHPALQSGADVVIESLHKTLPSLTQTAIIHKKSELVDEQRLSYFLQIYQSSSPSYVLMASIERCIAYMAGNDGKRAMKQYEERLFTLRTWIHSRKQIRLMTGADGGGAAYDPSKLVLRVNGLTGPELYDRLREQYHIQPEMCTETYVILMTSPADTEEMYQRLRRALEELDRGAETVQSKCENQAKAGCTNETRTGGAETVQADCVNSVETGRDKSVKTGDPADNRSLCGLDSSHSVILPVPKVVMTPADAMEQPMETLPFSNCAGRISGEFLYLYPPGVPVAAPGEEITEEIIGILKRYEENRLEINGPAEAGKLRVLKRLVESELYL